MGCPRPWSRPFAGSSGAPRPSVCRRSGLSSIMATATLRSVGLGTSCSAWSAGRRLLLGAAPGPADGFPARLSSCWRIAGVMSRRAATPTSSASSSSPTSTCRSPLGPWYLQTGLGGRLGLVSTDVSSKDQVGDPGTAAESLLAQERPAVPEVEPAWQWPGL